MAVEQAMGQGGRGRRKAPRQIADSDPDNAEAYQEPGGTVPAQRHAAHADEPRIVLRLDTLHPATGDACYALCATGIDAILACPQRG